MDFNKNIVILILLLLIATFLLCNFQNNNENFTSKYVANDHIYQGHRRDGYDLLDDSLFNKVKVYNNDDDLYDNCNSQSGLEKCLESCPGKCLEFGPGFSSFCFPKDETQ
jgi:hypothetical protein